MTENMKGSGGATAELEALRERIAALEGGVSRAPSEPVRRMVPIWGAANGIDGKPPMGPAPAIESLGDRLVRREFADIGRADFVRNEEIAKIGREIVADTALRQTMPDPSPGNRVVEGMIDTRTGLPSEGPELEPWRQQTNALVDRAAKYYADLDRAEAIKRHNEAFGTDEDDPGETEGR